MASTVHPLYLRHGADAVFGFYHPATRSPMRTGVLICPPFGWDETCSYRSRRDWACELAGAGFPAMRIDLPGTGDSGGVPREQALLSRWTAAVSAAAGRLRELAGTERTAAIGIGLGGLVLCNAIAEGAPVEEAVLWGVPARGSALLRELRVFSRLEDSDLGPVADSELAPPPLPDGCLWAGGFLLSAETVADLEQLDISALALGDGRLSRVLMLERDGLGVDKRLRSHLERGGVDVDVAPGKGWGAMLAQPHEARAPRAVFARVEQWLREGEPGEVAATAPGAAPPAGEDSIELALGDTGARETPITVAHPRGTLFGILTEPLDGPAPLVAVLLNAGAIRRIGPNRMWVEAARRWAGLGVATLRLDLEGIGDAEGDPDRLTDLAELYTQELVDQVRSALDALEQRGAGRRFVLGGLCSGAYWSFHAALHDERVLGALMLNPKALFWDESLEASRVLRRGVMRTSAWRKLARGQVPLERVSDLIVRAPVALPRRALARRSARRRGESDLEAALDRLRDTDKTLRFVFSGDEPLCEELELEGFLARLDRWPNMTVEFIPGHIHTLRPLQSQEGAHAALDRALTEMLGQVRDTVNASPAGGS